MMTARSVFLAGLVMSVGLVGCNKDSAGSKSAPKNVPPAAAPAAPGASRVATAGGGHGQGQGDTVLETMNAGGYTYAKLATAGGEKWVAGPETTLAVGDKVQVDGGQLMTDFHSNTLDRTFPEIYFISSFGGGGAPSPGTMAAHGEVAGHGAPATGHTGAPEPGAAEVGNIEPAAGGARVADVHANKAKLAGKPVTLRGKVVKYNGGIMGRNWLHLQDGSGAAAEGTHDITVTTADAAAVGDVVTITGTVSIDKDFGGGYAYAVIVEDAKLEAK